MIHPAAVIGSECPPHPPLYPPGPHLVARHPPAPTNYTFGITRIKLPATTPATCPHTSSPIMRTSFPNTTPTTPRDVTTTSTPESNGAGGWWEIPWVENMMSGWGLLGYTEIKATILLVLWWVWAERRSPAVVGLRGPTSARAPALAGAGRTPQAANSNEQRQRSAGRAAAQAAAAAATGAVREATAGPQRTATRPARSARTTVRETTTNPQTRTTKPAPTT